jgi:hypothetical protein
MAKMNFDFKQFMLQKGERVGLYVAAGLAVLLIALGVIMLAGRNGSLSPGANAADMQKVTQEKEDLIGRNAPKPDVLTKLTAMDPVIADGGKNMKLDYNSSWFVLGNLWFPPMSSLDERRREPLVYQPTEFLVKAFGIQADFYMFGDDKKSIYILTNPPPPKDKDKNDPKKKNRGGNPSPSDVYSGNMMAQMQKGGGGAGGGISGPGSAPGMPSGMKGAGSGSMNFGPGKFGPPGGHGGDTKKVITLVQFEDLQKSGSVVFAENMHPMQVAMVVGSFPLKSQLEEFQKALHARNSGELFGGAKPDFRFLGIKVQRRTVTPDGKEAEWIDLPVEDAAKWWALNNGKRAEPENPDLLPILQWSSHLAMMRPKQFDESPPYPPLETELATIKKSLEALKDKPIVAPSNPFTDPDSLDAYDLSHITNGKEMDNGTGKGTNPPKGPGGPGVDGPEGKDGQPTNPFAGQQVQVPEFALIRFLDIYLEPGKTYEYQVKVLMANPNFKRKDVREDLAGKDHLESEWTLVPQKLAVGAEEIHYYAVDQKGLEPRDSKHKFDDIRLPDGKHQIVMQIHKWLNTVSAKRDAPSFPVGDWSVAEREVVYRGERIGQVHTVEVPFWMFDQAQFVLMTNPAERLTKDKHKIHVSFGATNNDAVLVDFTDPVVWYKRTTESKEDGGAPVQLEVKDTVPQEVLVLSPEGKLLVHNTEADKDDKERKDRLAAWRKKIEDMDKKSETKPGKDDPFSKPGGPGGSGGQ